MFLPDTTSVQQGRVLRGSGGGGGRGAIGQNTGVVGPGSLHLPPPVLDPSGGHEPGGFTGVGGDRAGGRAPQPSDVLPKSPKPAAPPPDPYAAARWRKEHPWEAPGYQDPGQAQTTGQSVGPLQPHTPAFQPPPPLMEGFGVSGGRGMIGRY